MMTNWGAETVVARAPQVVSAALGGEVAILDPKLGLYFGLNDVGARVWELAATDVKVSAICEAIFQEFEVERAQCESEILGLLQELVERGLLIHQEASDA